MTFMLDGRTRDFESYTPCSEAAINVKRLKKLQFLFQPHVFGKSDFVVEYIFLYRYVLISNKEIIVFDTII